jgi:hypothetical protein
MANIEKINLLKPICYLHKDEKYYPMNLEEYLENCYIKKNKELIKLKYDNINEYNNVRELYPSKNINNAKYKSLYRGNPDVNKIPFIVKVNDLGNGKSQVIFFFFFGYNGERRIFNDLIKIGKHYADIENIYMVINNNILNKSSTKKEALESIESVFVSSHNGVSLLKLKDFEKENDSIIIYIANRTHASFPKEGLYFRYFGFGNDYTGKHYRWYPELYIIDNNTNIKLNDFIKNYKGNVGFNNVSSFASKKYFNGYIEKNNPDGYYMNETLYEIIIKSFFIIILILFSKEFYLHYLNKFKIINTKKTIIFITIFIFLIIFYSVNTTYVK